MSFGKDYTPEEEAKIAEIESVFERLYPDDPSKREFGVSVALLRTYFVRSARHASRSATNWCAVLNKIHGEIVVRLGQNIRKTTKVQNQMLLWRTAFLACESATSSTSSGSDGVRTLGMAWMNGLVEYFKERLDQCITQLNIRQAEEDCISPGSPHGGRAPLTMDGEQMVTRCIASARAIVNPQMSASPYFVQAVAVCREMVQVLQLVQGFLYFFSSHFGNRNSASGGNSGGSGGIRRANTVELNFSDDYLAPLRTPKWLFRFIFLFLGAMDLLQDPRRDAAVLSGGQLDYAIHCIACLVGEVDGKRKDSDVKSTLDALVLGHVKNSCLSEFPPQQTLDLLSRARSAQNQSATNEEGAAAEGVAGAPDLLLQQVLVRYPTFMTAITNFARRNGVEEWGVSVMIAQLYCWDVATPPAAAGAAAQVGRVRYRLPETIGSASRAEDAFTTAAVYGIAREVLRPLLSSLLSAAGTPGSSGGAVGGVGSATSAGALAGAAGEGSVLAGGSSSGLHGSGDHNGLLLSPAEQKLCAVLLGVVGWLSAIDFPDAARMTRWGALDVGPQIMREFNLGKWCLVRVLREVLREVTGVALQQLEAQADETPEAQTAQDDPLAAPATPLLRYLLRVERVWNALTDHAIELDSAAFEDMQRMGVKVLPKAVATVDFTAVPADTSAALPGHANAAASRARYDTGLLADYKYEFYEAVQAAMRARWPKAYADLLTEPLLDSIHVYLVHTESAAQRGLGGPRPGVGVGGPGAVSAGGVGAGVRGGAPAPASAGAARLPPKPEAVPLTSLADLHGALRLVRCIANRDHFIHRYTGSVRERLLARPPPDTIADADLEKNKKRSEQEVEQFLANWLGDAALLKTVRELHSQYAPQSATFHISNGGGGGGSGPDSGEPGGGRDFKLSSTILDWRLWGDSETVAMAAAGSATATAADENTATGSPAGPSGAGGAAPAALPNTATELRAVTAQVAATATNPTAPLPFPNDVLPFLEEVELRYNNDHGARTLRWDWRNHVFTSFTLAYPKENGRLTTVNGTLLLQRLFLAIAAYGRAGVELGTLARRAGLPEARVMQMLNPCLNRDRLLVRVGGGGGGAEGGVAAGATGAVASPSAANPAPGAASPTMKLALNYDYTRPPNRPRGDYIYWPDLTRRRFAHRGADQAATVQKRRDIIKFSILQVMKQVQRIQHDELFAMVREKNASRFDVVARIFKQVIEDLIGKDYMARADDNQNEYVFRA